MLREELDSVTDDPDCSQHPILLAALHYSHTIQPIESDRLIDQYTCFMHVLGLYDQDDYISVAISGARDVFANSTFVSYLIERAVLCEKSDAGLGDIILYFRDGAPAHAGLVVGDGRVVSKWGIGHLYEHNVYEVPAKYGREVRYYHPVAADTALDHFLEYAEQCGAFEP